MKTKIKGRHKSAQPLVSAEHLASAIKTVAAMSLKEKEAVCDTLYATQPNLLGLVLVQSSLGATMETVDVLLNILIVFHISIENSGHVLGTVSEADLKRNLERAVATIRFTEGLDEKSFDQSVQQVMACETEKVLLAYAIDTMLRAGFPNLRYENSKYHMLAGINIVNCIATAERVK
ncbi:MAG: hypothetical protein AAFW82_04305 [Pseudomonadota bacterium]